MSHHRNTGGRCSARVHIFAGLILLFSVEYSHAGIQSLLEEINWLGPVGSLLIIALITILYALFRGNDKGKKLLTKVSSAAKTTSKLKLAELIGAGTKRLGQGEIDMGIGTGVVKIFQQIKDNIGNLKTLKLGYRHLLDLACDHLGFEAGAIFLIEKDGSMRLSGHAGLNPDSGMSYTISNKGLMADVFRSDIPRFESDISRISGQTHDLFANYRSAWLMPLAPQGKPAGIIVLLHSEFPEGRENYFPRLDLVGIAATWFYENHYNQMLIDKENKRTRTLIDTSLAISMSLDLNKVCDVLVTHLGSSYGCSFSYILLTEEDDNVLHMQGYFSERGKPLFHQDEKQIDISAMSWLHDLIYLANPALLSMDEIRSLPEPDRAKLKLAGSTSALMAPLKYAGKFEGLLVMVEQRSGGRSRMDQDAANLIAAVAAQASAAIENARMYSLISDRVAHLGAMYDVSQALNSGLDLIPFFDRVLRTISRNFHLSNCAFLLIDNEDRELYVASIIGNYPAETIGRRLKLGEGITGQAALLGAPVNVGDTSQDSKFIKSTGNTGSELAVPVILNGKTVGVLDVESREKHAFSQREEELLKSIVDQVAVAIEKLKLKQMERERASKLALTNALVKKLSGILDKSELLSETVKSVKEGFFYDLAAIFMVQQNGSLTLAHQSCPAGRGYETGLVIEGPGSLIHEVATTGMSKFTESIEPGEPEAGYEDIQSRFCIPLMAGKSPYGVLEVQDRKKNAISQVDQSILQTIAEFLSLTLNNVILYRDTMNKADRLGLACQVNQAISATLDLEELFTSVVKSLSEVTGYYWATMVFKVGKKYETSFDQFNSRQKDELRITPLSCLDKYFNEALEQGGPSYYSVSQLNINEKLKQYFLDQGINFLAISPIKHDGTDASFLVVGNPRPEGFKPQDKDLLLDVSQHLSIALKNATLYSELKKAYTELAQAQDKLIQHEKFKALGEIAAGIAHDFKNILASIMGRAQMLSVTAKQSEGIPPELLEKSIEVIEKSAADGVSILSRINEFSKSKTDIELVPLDINEVIRDTIEMTRHFWSGAQSNKKIEMRFDSAGELMVNGDRAMMVEVFTNLIYNAVDAISNEGTIAIKADKNNEEVIIELKDDGSGIDRARLGKIFDPFFTTKKRLGTGLGLTMVYSIIDSHKGTIAVDSVKGKGTRFIITLPLLQDGQRKKSQSILVVEDDANLRNVLDELFSEINARVVLAGNCQEALQALSTTKFDIIFTDLGLPDRDGWAVIDTAKEVYPECFIVPMTGWNKEIERRELIARGLSNVLLKPFTLEQVNEIINNFNKRKKNVGDFA